MSIELNKILDQMVRDKGIDKEKLIESVKAAVLSASRKRYGFADNVEADFDLENNDIKLFANKCVVKEVKNSNLEISLEEGKKINPEIKTGENIRVPLIVENLGRIAAHSAKQVLFQKVREAEHDVIYNMFKDKKGQLINGVIARKDRGDIYIDLIKTEALLPRREQSFRENFRRGDRLKAYVLDVRKGTKDEQIILSRTHPGFLIKLFELEVPEVDEGIVEIKAAAREPSGRSKIAVLSHKKDVDPIGACVGMRGIRIQSISEELCNEKIDIVVWSDDPVEYLKNALSPAKVHNVFCKPENRHLEAIVPDDQLSLAIGKKGQNVKLAVKLLQWNIDIRKLSEFNESTEKQIDKLTGDATDGEVADNTAEDIVEDTVKDKVIDEAAESAA